ncbi:MAG: tetratricopeptide repeat protein [Bacteroidales bacterium]|nr:tetratricopeptide repeat protein [Bacteroidales bacterium]
MKFAPQITFLLVAILINSCSFIPLGLKKDKSKDEVPGYQDSLEITSVFIEAKKEALLGNDELAVKLYNRVLEKDPKHDAALFELSRMYSTKGQYNKAEPFAERAVKSNPNNAWYRKMLVDLYQRTGKLEKSREQLKWLVQHEKNNLQFYQDWYQLERYLENYDEALRLANEIEKITGVSENSLLKKIRLLQETGDYQKAAEETEKLLLLDNTNPEYYRELIALYNQNNEPHKAIKAIKRFKETGKDKGWADLMLARQYQSTGNKKASFEALKTAVSNPELTIDAKVEVLMSYFVITEATDSLKDQASILLSKLENAHPDNPVTYSIQGDFYVKNEEYKKALAVFEKVIQLDSTKYPVWEQTLRLQFQLGQNKKTSKYAKRALKIFPTQPILYFLKGAAHTKRNEYQEAVDVLEKGLYFVADSKLKVDFYSYLGDNYHQLGKYDESDDAYEKALQLDPDNNYVLNNFAYYLSLRKENLSKALEMSKKVTVQYPDNATYLDTHAWVLFQMGHYDKALRVFKKAMDNGGYKSAEILEHYADCLFMNGQKEKAVQFWKKALNKNPENNQLQQKINKKEINP